MPEQDRQLTDRDLVSRLLDLSSELFIKGDTESAFTVTQAAARILAIPHVAHNVQHPSGKVPADVNPIQAVVDAILNSSKEGQ